MAYARSAYGRRDAGQAGSQPSIDKAQFLRHIGRVSLCDTTGMANPTLAIVVHDGPVATWRFTARDREQMLWDSEEVHSPAVGTGMMSQRD